MTVSSENKRTQYTGSGSTGPYVIDFPILAKEDIKVTKTDASSVDTVLTLDAGSSGFTVDSGLLNVTLTESLDSGEQLTIERDLSITQEVDYQANSAFPAEVNETAIDRLTMIAQQIQDGIDRSVKLASTASTSINPILTGSPVDGELLSWDGTSGNIGNTSVADLDLTIDTTFTSLANKDFMQYNGTVWENITVAEVKTELDIKQDNYAGSAAPTVNDDSDDGYSVGSRWYDTTGDDMYHCLDATVGAAVWQQGDIIASDLGSAAVANLIDADDFTGATSSNINSAEATKAYVDASVPDDVLVAKAVGYLDTIGGALTTNLAVNCSAVRNSTGNVTVTLDSAMSSTNYVVVASFTNDGDSTSSMQAVEILTTSTFRLKGVNSSNTAREGTFFFTVFGTEA